MVLVTAIMKATGTNCRFWHHLWSGPKANIYSQTGRVARKEKSMQKLFQGLSLCMAFTWHAVLEHGLFKGKK